METNNDHIYNNTPDKIVIVKVEWLSPSDHKVLKFHKNRKEKSINFVLKNKGATEVVYKKITEKN